MPKPDQPLSSLGLAHAVGSVKLIAHERCFAAVDGSGFRDVAHIGYPGGLVGRAKYADACIDRPHVSHDHCMIEPLGPDWVVRDVGSRAGTVVRGVARGESLALARGFPWVLDDGLALVLGGRTEILVEINRPKRTAATTVAQMSANEPLPEDLFEAAVALTVPYREIPARQGFTPVLQMIPMLPSVSSREGVYRRLRRLREWPMVQAELQRRADLSKARGIVPVAEGGVYGELAAALVVVYPGLGEQGLCLARH